MSATGYLVVAGIILVLGYCTLILLVQIFAEWSERREAERTAAATWAAAYIPDSSEIEGPDAEVDALIALSQIEDMLDEALATVRTWSK